MSAEFIPDPEWSPDPLPSGRLGPPRRKPPTAVGTATPRPPRPPGRRGYRHRPLWERVARKIVIGIANFFRRLAPI
jgi:hypothetical protein